MRALDALPAALIALLPLSVLAAATPSPAPAVTLSPTLDKVLLAPPGGYAQVAASGTKNGHFTAHDWAQGYGVKSAEAERVLTQYGFVDGYNLTWAAQATQHAVNEFVMAFPGGRDATRWFDYDKAYETAQAGYQHADPISGIPQYFGVHESQSSAYGQAFLDGFIFVKGNDVIGVAYISLKDDNAAVATAQAKSQYTAAPASTIPAAQWPENANSTGGAQPVGQPGGGGLAKVLPYALFGGAALIAIALAAGLLLIRTRRARVAPAATAAVPAPAPGTQVAPVTLPQQLSVDGKFWYDGERWVDVDVEAPAFAPRSPDGAFWWDGAAWHQVPIAQAPASGR